MEMDMTRLGAVTKNKTAEAERFASNPHNKEACVNRATGRIKLGFGLAGEWLDYIRHLKLTYPYLHSLSVRLNLLDPNAKVEIADSAASQGIAAGFKLTGQSVTNPPIYERPLGWVTRRFTGN